MKTNIIIFAVFCGLCCTPQVWSDTNSELFLTISTRDLVGKSTNELAEILAPLEAWYTKAQDIHYADISEFDYMNPDEKQRWEHDSLVWKIITVRQEQATKSNLFINAFGLDPITLLRTNEPPPASYISLDDILNNVPPEKQPQQSVPGYPPQGVGSPEP